MKNAIILGLVALLLFSISAGLSVWLNQSRSSTVPPAEGMAAKKGSEADKAAVEHPRPGPKGEAGPATAAADQPSALKDREARLDRRQAQIELVLQDLRTERERVDSLRKQVAVELQAAMAKSGEIEARAQELEQLKQAAAKSTADLQKKQAEPDPSEKKNIERMATMYDSMPADKAATILQQMADSGRMDTAVKILSQMKERQAARVLAELPDAALAAQLLEKMRVLKRPAQAGTSSNLPSP